MMLSYKNARTAAIDKLGWLCTAAIKSYGVSVGLRANQEGLLSAMMQLTPPSTREAAGDVVQRVFSVRQDETGYHLYNSSRKVVSTTTQEEILEWFEAKCRLYIAEHSPERLFVHAGVVYWRERLIVIPGRSFSGKTTMVKTLLQDGAVYYSDEYALFDEEGFVHPFSTPLGIREIGGSSQTKQEAESFGVEVGVTPRRVDRVLATRYKKGATGVLQEVGAGQGVLLLLANTVAARRAPQRALAILTAALQRAKVLKGDRGEAKEILNYLLL